MPIRPAAIMYIPPNGHVHAELGQCGTHTDLLHSAQSAPLWPPHLHSPYHPHSFCAEYVLYQVPQATASTALWPLRHYAAESTASALHLVLQSLLMARIHR